MEEEEGGAGVGIGVPHLSGTPSAAAAAAAAAAASGLGSAGVTTPITATPATATAMTPYSGIPPDSLWEEEKNRSRVKVDLGTWVYPRVPFPYFFECGSGLVGARDREDEKERRERERDERERAEKEMRERGKREGEKEKEKEQEEGEIEEVTVKEEEESKENEKAKDKGIASFKPASPIRLPEPALPPPPPLNSEPPQPSIDIETRTTIIIPSGFIPAEKPLRPQLWGGGAFAPGRPPRPSNPNAIAAKSKHHRHTSSKLNALTGLHVLAGSRRARKTRRVYTDDSDILLCAIHAGWITWSGAWRAKERGRDVKLDIRVIRVAGAGNRNIFARGVYGVTRPGSGHSMFGHGSDGGGDPPMIREEMIGRFTGGFGERCFHVLGKMGRMVGEGVVGAEGEEGMEDGESIGEYDYDDPEDDGRSLVSGGWGTGHDGSAIEIVNVQFVEVGCIFYFSFRCSFGLTDVSFMPTARHGT